MIKIALFFIVAQLKLPLSKSANGENGGGILNWSLISGSAKLFPMLKIHDWLLFARSEKGPCDYHLALNSPMWWA